MRLKTRTSGSFSARKVVLSFVAGTLLPVDCTYGILPAVAALTQKTLSPERRRDLPAADVRGERGKTIPSFSRRPCGR